MCPQTSSMQSPILTVTKKYSNLSHFHPIENLNLNVSVPKTKLKLDNEGPDPECDKKCANNGWCNHDKICQCPEGYMGQNCQTALCYPSCMNGGNCTSPAVCSCPRGYQGRHCEGGECKQYEIVLKFKNILFSTHTHAKPTLEVFTLFPKS
jgi:hypothetical protein